MMGENAYQNRDLRAVYHKTRILRKPMTGIVSGYHDLPYVLVSPDEKNPSNSVKVNGRIHVSPRFILPPGQLNGESFGDVFDPETFDQEIEARMFSFVYSRKGNVKLENTQFEITGVEEGAEDHVKRVLDDLMRQEDIQTGLIFGPRFPYYPVSVDRFISEIIEREFNV